MSVRVRFAPSPTGNLHIGGARTALFNWLFAKKHNGTFILRVEDTDQSRYKANALEDQMRSLRWLGLQWDEGPDVSGPHAPYTQSERVHLYRYWAQWLLENGFAYKDFTTTEELDKMRDYQKENGLPIGYDRCHRDLSAEEIAELEESGKPYTIRFKAPLEGITTFTDEIRGDIVFQNEQIQDTVLLKSDGFPTYHLANVVDDHFMEITHIIRGDEWINSTPLHVNLYQAFGWEPPKYAHLPVILSPSGNGKLSKRDQAFKDGEHTVLVQVHDYIDAGFLPEATVNFLTNVGWSFGDDVEIFNTDQSIERFELKDVNPSPTKLPFSKLEWLNGQYIQELPVATLAKNVHPIAKEAGFDLDTATLESLMPAMSIRMKKFEDALPFLEFLKADKWAPNIEKCTHKQMGQEAAVNAFTETLSFITNTDYTLDTLSEELHKIGLANSENGKPGPFLGTTRYAITGQDVSPPLFESILALGKEETVRRLNSILEQLTA